MIGREVEAFSELWTAHVALLVRGVVWGHRRRNRGRRNKTGDSGDRQENEKKGDEKP